MNISFVNGDAPSFNMNTCSLSEKLDFYNSETVVIPPIEDDCYKPTIIHTGVVINDNDKDLYFKSDLEKVGLILISSVGVKDGEVLFAVYNISKQPVTLKKGESIGHGVFSR